MFGSHFMIGLEGEALSKSESQFLIQEQIAGVILFKRNLKSFEQVYELCLELKSLPLKESLLIGIDMEGGQVDRLCHLPESFPWPSASQLSQRSNKEIFQVAYLMAQCLKSLKIDINFAPVVDWPLVASPLLETRTFGNKEQDILEKATCFKEGLLKGHIIPCLKHFPGHGGVSEDSHKKLPQDVRPLEALQSQMDLFKKLQEQACIMTAHIEFPKVDSYPATFSTIFLQKELRQKRNFEGVIVSDDIDMHALDKFTASERVFQALKAGCDLILSCQKKETYLQAIEGLKKQHLDSGFVEQLELARNRLSKLRAQAYQKESQGQDFKTCFLNAKEFLEAKGL